MSSHLTNDSSMFRVIEGGAPTGFPSQVLADTDMPEPGASELAADMAEMFVMGLLGSCPLDSLDHPHAVIPIAEGKSVTLHELLCELRNLPWCDAHSMTETDPWSSNCSLETTGEASHRRATRWNGDGQLTLPTMFRSGVALRGHSAEQSSFYMGRRAGLREMAIQVQRTGPVRSFVKAAETALHTGADMDPGLDSDSASADRVIQLMHQAVELAQHLGAVRLARISRLSRPIVTAARMSLYLSKEEAGHQPAPYRQAADELAAYAPSLLGWVEHANARPIQGRSCDRRLFLPLAPAKCAQSGTQSGSDSASHVLVAGALATLIKAAFHTVQDTNLHMVGGPRSKPALAEQADLMAAQISLGRVVLGSHYPSENHQELRLGQSIALYVLRDAMARDNQSASVSFRDFDGDTVQLVAHPRHFGQGAVALLRNGTLQPWPQDENRASAHLTAV